MSLLETLETRMALLGEISKRVSAKGVDSVLWKAAALEPQTSKRQSQRVGIPGAHCGHYVYPK